MGSLLLLGAGGHGGAAAGPASDAWTLVASWTHSVNTPNVDFTGLASYSEIRVLVKGVTSALSGSRAVIVSTNNGSSFMNASGNYIWVDGDGVATNNTTLPFLSTGGSTAALSGEMIIAGWNLTANKTVLFRNRTDNGTAIIPTASPLNALRVIVNGSINMTGGNIYVFGRP